MNVKLHTPKSLKTGSGMSSWRQFLLSLLATTVSIALTFGTAAIIDYNKKQREKREIVMMVMYDMYNSLELVEYNDSAIFNLMQLQLQLAEDTTRFSELWAELVMGFPSFDYTETTERIFSSSIETINTVGNVLFTENVAEYYQFRHYYKTMICDSILHDLTDNDPFPTLKRALDYQFKNYAIISGGFKVNMQRLFAQCKQMMNVSDEELEAYRKERMQMEKSISDRQNEHISVINKVIELQKEIDSAKDKLYLK